MSGRARLALVVLAALGGCGVKAPPRAAGASDQAAPSDLFRPVEDPNKPGTGFVRPDEEAVQPPAPPDPAASPVPPAPETAR